MKFKNKIILKQNKNKYLIKQNSWNNKIMIKILNKKKKKKLNK